MDRLEFVQGQYCSTLASLYCIHYLSEWKTVLTAFYFVRSQSSFLDNRFCLTTLHCSILSLLIEWKSKLLCEREREKDGIQVRKEGKERKKGRKESPNYVLPVREGGKDGAVDEA